MLPFRVTSDFFNYKLGRITDVYIVTFPNSKFLDMPLFTNLEENENLFVLPFQHF